MRQVQSSGSGPCGLRQVQCRTSAPCSVIVPVPVHFLHFSRYFCEAHSLRRAAGIWRLSQLAQVPGGSCCCQPPEALDEALSHLIRRRDKLLCATSRSSFIVDQLNLTSTYINSLLLLSAFPCPRSLGSRLPSFPEFPPPLESCCLCSPPQYHIAPLFHCPRGFSHRTR